MSTALTTYQRLALSEQAALSLRKHASRRLLAFEQAADEQASERLVIEGLMRADVSRSGRGTASSEQHGVAVTATTVRASEPQRVPDSHDARPGSQRAAQRDYSEHQFRRDVREGRSPAAQCGDCISYRVPVWVARGFSSEELTQLLSHSQGHLFAHPSDERDERAQRRLTLKQADNERRAARMRAAAGTIRMGEQD